MNINNNILTFLKEYSFDINKINRLIISSFCSVNSIDIIRNKKINQLLIDKKTNQIEYNAFIEFVNLFKKHNQEFSFERLIELFEFVISPSDKLINGAVYTPKNIRKFIVTDSVKDNDELINSTACDIACGCGGFLYEFAVKLNERGKSYSNIFKENIFGLDITNYSIERTKILLSLLAISNNEDKQEFEFNLFIGDSLDFDWFLNCKKANDQGGFDYVFGNPPYVSSLNLDEKTKLLMKNWQVSSTGKLDLYIPFFEIGMKWLKEGGKLGYITVNNFYRSLNGRALRSYFSDNEFKFKFIDFGNEQIFKGRLTYTCICEITKQKGEIYCTRILSEFLEELNDEDFAIIKYENLDDFNGWVLDEYEVKLNIDKIEKAGVKLGELFEIRNGFATLRNKIYLFTPIDENEDYYFFEKDSKIYQIERNVCRDAIKPNILKTEADILTYREKLIFPYELLPSNTKVSIIEEISFERDFPFAYEYLKTQKSELKKRDKGNRNYETWYAFGRSQALNLNGLKLFFPYISDKPYFVFSNDEDLLFYNGYTLISDNEEELRFIQKILTSKIFWYYIKNTSKPYSGNYFALAKNYVKNFSIPAFTNTEKRRFMLLRKESSITRFLEKKFKISI